MHILVTGGAGFIGSHLVEHHLARGDKVHAVDDLSTGARENVAPFLDNPLFRFTQADIVTWDELYKAAAWADRIYHMAAVVGVHKVLEEPIKCLATNIAGCERVLRAASAGGWKPQLVIASTAEVYGKAVTNPAAVGLTPAAGAAHASLEPFPGFGEEEEITIGSTAVKRWNYPISKVTNEALGLSYGQAFGMPVLIARFFNAVGPRQTGRYGMVVPRFVEQAAAGRPITIYGDGDQTRSFCDVRDTVAMVDALASNPASAGEIVNVGNDREISIRGLAELIKARAGSASPLTFTSYREAYGEGNVETLRRKPNLSKLARLIPYRHRWRLEDTVDDLIARQRQKARGE
jgi:UDP-glucose 4-epimerase